MQAKPDNTPQLVKETINKIDKNAEVILFGSRARGDHSLDSDWDFLILLSKPLDLEVEVLVRNELYEIELEKEEVITSIIEEKSKWKNYKESLIYQNIEEQGLLLSSTI